MPQGLSTTQRDIVQTFMRAREENIASLCALKRACHDEGAISPVYAAVLATYGLVSYDAKTRKVAVSEEVRSMAQIVLMGEDVTISPMYR